MPKPVYPHKKSVKIGPFRKTPLHKTSPSSMVPVGFTSHELRTLRTLRHITNPFDGLNRDQLAKATGILTGWGNILLGFPVQGRPRGLVQRGMVLAIKHDSSRKFTYSITALGIKSLGKAERFQ